MEIKVANHDNLKWCWLDIIVSVIEGIIILQAIYDFSGKLKVTSTQILDLIFLFQDWEVWYKDDHGKVWTRLHLADEMNYVTHSPTKVGN